MEKTVEKTPLNNRIPKVPFNILWKNRPLSDEEQEVLTTGPGVGLVSFSTGVSDDGTAKVKLIAGSLSKSYPFQLDDAEKALLENDNWQGFAESKF